MSYYEHFSISVEHNPDKDIVILDGPAPIALSYAEATRLLSILADYVALGPEVCNRLHNETKREYMK